MTSERIVFRGVTYPLYIVSVDGIDEEFVSDEAYRIDMGISYYLSDDELNLSTIQIQNLIRHL